MKDDRLSFEWNSLGLVSELVPWESSEPEFWKHFVSKPVPPRPVAVPLRTDTVANTAPQPNEAIFTTPEGPVRARKFASRTHVNQSNSQSPWWRASLHAAGSRALPLVPPQVRATATGQPPAFTGLLHEWATIRVSLKEFFKPFDWLEKRIHFAICGSVMNILWFGICKKVENET